MTREDIKHDLQALIEYFNDERGASPICLQECLNILEQEFCEDAVSRQAVLDIDFNRIIHTTAKPAEMIKQKVEQLPPVKPQESSITWVTGADGAKIAFWDVPVWKVTKICEILDELQEGGDKK